MTAEDMHIPTRPMIVRLPADIAEHWTDFAQDQEVSLSALLEALSHRIHHDENFALAVAEAARQIAPLATPDRRRQSGATS